MQFLKFSQDYGIVGIFVMLTIFVLMKVGEFLWQLKKEKDTSTDETLKKLILAVEENSKMLEKHASALNDFPKFRIDVRRFYSAIKQLSGDKWPAIRDEILKDDFTL